MRPEGCAGYDGPPLTVSYDHDTDMLTVEGQQYSGQLFREWAKSGMPTGTLFELTRASDGAIGITRIWPKVTA